MAITDDALAIGKRVICYFNGIKHSARIFLSNCTFLNVSRETLTATSFESMTFTFYVSQYLYLKFRT